MKVHRRGASSPSLLLEASEPPTSVNVNGNYYQFELEPHHVEKGKRGQKLFVCDLCPAPNGVFKRSFSLKRHYLRFHINFAFLSPRDLNNCAIAVASQHQRSGYPASGVNNGLINRLSSSSPLLYRCHQCGCLLRTKNDLLKHLETHPGPSANEAEKLVNNGDHRGTNRCPRCSTAFSLRKTLMRHIKKNRCRGGGPPLAGPPPSKSESETVVPSGETSDQCAESDLVVRVEEESEEMDMEASLRLGCPTSLFRFACTLCTKMFNSYVNMCRHRRLAHGRYGICSPHWLLSRKLSGKSMINHSVPSPVITMTQNIQNSQDLSHFVQNANDNLTQFIDGKYVHIRSTVPADARFDVPNDSVPPPDRWSWKETNYNFHELQKLDVPLQLAYYRGLQLWKIQEAAKMEDSSSQAEPEEIVSVSSALNLRPVETIPSAKVETSVSPPELSGEWVRSKSYICAPCGHLFHDFLVLLDHQQAIHNGIVCTHIQLDQSSEVGLAEELIRQIRRSGNGGSTNSTTFQCTKCHFIVQSIAELHSHILLCSNHVSASPSRKRRFKVNPSSRRSHWSQSRGMQRTISSQPKNSSAPRSLRSRSPREEVAEDDASGSLLRRSARRVLSFNEKPPSKKKKKNATVSKRVLRQRPDTPRVNGTTTPKTIQNEVKKKATPAANTKSSTKVVVDVHECDGCQKTFQSRTSVLKHKHYCPNKQTESIVDAPSRTPTPPPPPKPVKVSVNGQSKIKTKPSTPGSSNAQGKLEHSSPKKQKITAKNVSSSPKTKSKTPVPSRSNGIHVTPKVLDANKKLATSKKTLVATPITSPVKTSSKSKPRLKDGPTKSKRKSPKTVVKEEEEDETIELEEATVTPGRPVRSSRKASMTLVMEDQVEASFLEALSPEQRVRVSEQRCPFCSKHYVYRSNFKKHLLEGCDTADADELPIIPTPTLKKPLIVVDEKRVNNVKKTPVSPDSKSEKKMTREKPDIKVIKVENSIKKRVIYEKEKDKPAKKVSNKKTEKSPKQIPKPVSIKPEETKKTTKKQRKTITVKEVTSVKLAQKIKNKVTEKKLADTGKMKIQRKRELVQSTRIEESDSENEIATEETAVIGKDFDELMGETSVPLLITKNKVPVESNGVDHINIERTRGDAINKELLIPESSPLVNDSVKENGKSEISTKAKIFSISNSSLSTASIYKVKSSNRQSPVPQKGEHKRLNMPSELNGIKVQSHALDKHRLGQALNDALKSGIFKSYASLTKYPVRMRQLKTMAQAYTAN